jgi:predicted  nucleic acid-binding Zn-ribbon protein
MAKTCIKCGYTRRDTDRGPDYACPGCGVVYAKAEAAHAQAEAARARSAAFAAAQAEAASRAPRTPVPAAAVAGAPPAAEGRKATDAMLQQLLAAQAGERRKPSAFKGVALIALVAFSLGFASAAGLYSGAARMGKSACVNPAPGTAR